MLNSDWLKQLFSHEKPPKFCPENVKMLLIHMNIVRFHFLPNFSKINFDNIFWTKLGRFFVGKKLL
jgi:hypothetical protein